VRIFEFVAAGVLGLMGLRTLIVWGRRRLDSTRLGDHVLYALWILSRAGLWFSVAGVFVISASIHERGRAFVDEWNGYRWYILVPLAFAVLQAATSYALGRSD
jgi:hypothetical protein